VRALILDQGLDRGALAAARGLARDGWEVGSCSPWRGLLASSRYVCRHHPLPPGAADAEELVAAVNAAADERGYDLVFPCDDGVLLALSQERARLRCLLPYGPHSGIVKALDKLELVRLAHSVGLAVPQTVPVGEAVARPSAFPQGVVLKPRRTFRPNTGLRLRSSYFERLELAVGWLSQADEEQEDWLVQEPIFGQLVALTTVRDRDGELVAVVAQDAERIWPTTNGVSAYARTVPADPQLVEGVGRLLERLEWFGLAQLQFLRVPGRPPYLIDLNGRFYGSLALAIGAGANLPAVWGRLALGLPWQRPVVAYGRRYQWLSGDLRAAVAGKPRRLWPLEAVAALARGRGAVHALWDPTDPLPALVKLRATLSMRLGR